MKLYLRKINNAYILDSGDDSDINFGEVISAEIRRPRNYEFHKKYFALLNIAYDVWEPTTKIFKGKVPEKNFDRFREDIVILAGYYELVIDIKGDAKARAKSISFGNMGEDEFACLYSKTINVILKHVLTNYNRSDIDEVVNKIIEFD